jgi:serine/threonine protein kinase
VAALAAPEAAPAQDRARSIGGRRLLARLGRANRYDTWLAWDDERLTPVVLKVLRRHLLDSPMDRMAVIAEAEALERLQHPVLVRSFGAQLDVDSPHLVLEFLDGPRLSTLLRTSGPLAAEQIVPLGLQLTAALHYMSGEGWVHLDVKPRNIIMTTSPRLIDLSVARTTDAARSIRGFVGTDAYMAPEQCDPDRFGEIGPPADVWALSATLYEAVSGVQAFPRLGGERFPQLRAERPLFPPKVPPAMAAAIRAGLEESPQARPRARELHDLFDALADWASRSMRRIR